MSDVSVSTAMYEAIDGAIKHLNRQLAVVDHRIGELVTGGFDPELAKAGAALAKAVKDVTGERRQLERHDKRMTSTPVQRFAELVKYIRTLDARELMELAGAFARTLDHVQRRELAALLAEIEEER